VFAFLRIFWALPCSLVGALLSLPLVCGGASLRRVGHTFEIALSDSENSAPQWAANFKFSAITFGHIIIGSSHEQLAHWRAHERVHVRQYERWGAFFLLAYPAASLWAWMRGECPYRGNGFEKQAYAAASGNEI
jgi:hypothetical protein